MSEERGVVVYEARDGQEIKLSFETIKRYLVSGKADVTEQELMYFMGVCKSRGLNPFIKDAYLIKYSDKEGAAIVTSVDYFRKRAKAQKDCKGWKKGIIVERNGQIVYSNGLMIEGDKLLGGWFRAQPEGWDEPFELEVNLKGYIKRKTDGSITKFWAPENQPSQIMKVAESQGLRTLWPDEFQQLYTPEELGEADMFHQAERKGKTLQMEKTEVPEGKDIYEVKEAPKVGPTTNGEDAPPPSDDPPPPSSTETVAPETMDEKALYREEWVNLRSAGYSTFIHKNFKRIEDNGRRWPDLYQEMKEKWAKLYKEPWPLVEKPKPQMDLAPIDQGEKVETDTDTLSDADKAFVLEVAEYREALDEKDFATILAFYGVAKKPITELEGESRERFLGQLKKALDKQNAA